MLTKLLSATVAAFLCISLAQAQNVVRIGFIDPLSGPAGPNGLAYLNSLKTVVEIANRDKWAGNTSFQLVEFDGKNNVQESVLQLKNASDQGLRFIAQGTSSAVGLALSGAIDKFNERNPGKELLFLDFGDAAAELTNENCNFWHFRFTVHSNMQADTLVSSLARDKSIKKVYLINQNYATGVASRNAMLAAVKRLRPDIEVVGDDLHPLLQIKDFSPYVAKIKSTGADAVLTANFGGDLILMLKSAKDSSLKVRFYTINSMSNGVPTALAAAGIEGVKNVMYWHTNDDPKVSKEIVEAYRKKYDDDFWAMPTYTTVAMLSKAIVEAKTTDPLKLAFALEGMKVKSLNTDVEMRKTDHQALQSMVVADWTRTNGKDVVYDVEKTGYGWKTFEKFSAAETTPTTTCQMTRPAR